MEINEIVEGFTQKANGKYVVAREDASPTFRWPFAPGLWQRSVLSLSRPANPNGLSKTILLANTEVIIGLEDIFVWCANVKGYLPDPGSADLYLFIIYEGLTLQLEECLQIEADDLYCRKYILRPNERLDDLLNRSFLCEVGEVSAGEHRSDPLRQALRETATNHSWLNEAEMERWRQILLTDASGNQLAQLLYQEPSNND
jgi:hypothetical protein